MEIKYKEKNSYIHSGWSTKRHVNPHYTYIRTYSLNSFHSICYVFSKC